MPPDPPIDSCFKGCMGHCFPPQHKILYETLAACIGLYLFFLYYQLGFSPIDRNIEKELMKTMNSC